MVTLGVDGLVSGLDTTSIITSLMEVEKKPQTLLTTELKAAQGKAAAYRAVNTRFDAIRTAAEALSAGKVQAARTASSTAASVSAVADATATSGSSVTFDVTALATKHALVLDETYTSTSTRVSVPAFPLTVVTADGTSQATIDVPSDATLMDVVSAVNGSSYGLNATVVQLGNGRYRLQIESKTSGANGEFSLQDADGAAVATTKRTQGQDASVDLGNGMVATSSSNTFANLISGTSVTVSKLETGVTVGVTNDTSSLSSKLQALVTAANGALGVIKGYTVSAAGSTTATLQGDRALVQLGESVLSAVSSAIGGRSLSSIGLQLNRDGTLAFDAGVFAAKLASDPTAVSALLSGTAATTTNGVTTPAVPGFADKVAALAKAASDSSTGTLVQLAKGRDTLASTIQDKVDAWDIRLANRKDTLTKQFTALETALSTIKNQSTWLTSQIAQLYNPNKSS